MSRSSASSSIEQKSRSFVRQLGSALLAELQSSDATSIAATASLSSLRAHLATVLRALPTDVASAAALRTHLLEAVNFDAAVAEIAKVLLQAQTQIAVSSSASLDSSRNDDAAASAVDGENSFLPLLLPFGSLANPSSRSIPTTTLLTHLESIFSQVRQLSLSHSSLSTISAIIDAATLRFSSRASTSSPLSNHELRRFQNLLALLLLEEAKRISAVDMADATYRANYITRIRSVLRRSGNNQQFNGTCLMQRSDLRYCIVIRMLVLS